ncbi:MAG: hypothetical protein WD135_07945 [Ferruginibacter sp.]
MFTTPIKILYLQLSICDTNSAHSRAELDGTGDLIGTPARKVFRAPRTTALGKQ